VKGRGRESTTETGGRWGRSPFHRLNEEPRRIDNGR